MPWEGNPTLPSDTVNNRDRLTMLVAWCVRAGYGTFIHNNVWRASHGEPCLDSDILEAFSHFVLNKLGCAPHDRHDQRHDTRHDQRRTANCARNLIIVFRVALRRMLKHNIPNEPRITLILRKDYMGRQLDRKISNEDQVVKALKEVSRGRASFSSVQLETMTFKEQVELMYSKTNILIGVHGAGLSHTVFLPPEVLLPLCRPLLDARAAVRVCLANVLMQTWVQAILIELLPDSIKSFTYFRNLAKQSNHIYIPVHVSRTALSHSRPTITITSTYAFFFASSVRTRTHAHNTHRFDRGEH